MDDFRISEEVAEDTFNLLLDYYDLDPEDFDSESQLTVFNVAKRRIVKAIRRGDVEVNNDDGIRVMQHLRCTSSDETLEYAELTGKNKLAMEKDKDQEGYGRIYALVGSMTSKGKHGISQLRGKDLSVMECLGAIFLQV